MASTPLQPNGTLVRLPGRVTLRTPGLAGYADVHMERGEGLRAVERSTPRLEATLAEAGFTSQLTVELDRTRETAVSSSVATRSTVHDEPALELTVPDPGEGQGQLVLALDEDGVITWNFAVDEMNQLDPPTRSASTRTYVLRRAVPETAGVSTTRSLFGNVGRKLLKVLVYPLLDDVLGPVGEFFVRRWEAKRRPHGVRWFEPGTFAVHPGVEVQGPDWQRLAAGRALLFVHGTFSRAESAFGDLDPEAFAELHRRYGGRVFAFNHPTMSVDPQGNVDWLLSALPADLRLDVDVVCHSRGGLVSRLLSAPIQVGRLVFVATPNAGTILTDPKHMGDFVDSYTNLVDRLPGKDVTAVLEAILTVVKQLAVGTLRGLDGLQSMNPSGAFLAQLNQPAATSTRYFALSAEFEPKDPGWKAWAADRIVDKAFGGAANDLVVPTAGVWDLSGPTGFPITDHVLFDGSAEIAHTNFFGKPAVARQLLEWLS